MQLVVLGLNHKTAPVEVRECFSFSEEQLRLALRRLRDQEIVEECVWLSTCNRTELYAVVEDAEEAYEPLKEVMTRMATGQQRPDDYVFYHCDQDCINHLFRVSSSLDSLVIGEGQILSQVKKAYSMARDAGTTSTVLNTLFHRAITVGKKVRTVTRIAYNAVSVSYAAVEMAKSVCGEMEKVKVLLLGAGEMGELTAKHLVASGVQTVFVSNRRYERAVDLAKRFHGEAVPFESFLQRAVDADIIITSTGAPHYMIRAWDMAHIMPKRQGRPIVLIDIAVPRDVEPETAAIQGVTLYNIDDLEAVVESNLRLREQEAKAAEEIIEKELAELVAKFRYLSFQPVMARLADKAEHIRQREMKRALTKLPDLPPEEMKIMESMSRMIIRKMLRDPMVRLNQAAGSEQEEYYLEAIRELFKLDAIGEGKHCEAKACYRYARQ